MTKEDVLQIQVMNFLRYQFPNILAFHTPNGGSRNAIEGSKLKKMGVVPGIPDVIIPVPRQIFSGLVIELKIKPNKPTKEQLEILEKFRQNKFKTEVCYDFDTATQTIKDYLQ